MSDFPSIPRLTSSKYFSSQLLLRNIWKGGDLSDDMQFQRVVNQRTYKGELILFAFDLCSVSDALNAVLMLRHVGFEHFLPLTDGAATCEALHALADVKALPTTPCFWSSSSNNHKGWDTWGAGAGCVSGERRRGYCKAEQLWAIRYHVAARLLASRVNLLHMDTDTVIFNDIYTRLKRKPISDYSLILLPESPVNGGLWYAQHTSLDSGAQWVIAEVARRTWEVISLRIRRRSSPPFDQAMLADALVSAMKGERHVAYMCEHPAVALQPPCANASQSRKDLAWRPRTSADAFGRHLGLTEARLIVPSSPEAGRVVRDNSVAGPRSESRRNERSELALLSPPWLLGYGWRVQRSGHFARRGAQPSVVHLLGVRCRWCLSSLDVDHGSKWEWTHLSGFFAGNAYLPSAEQWRQTAQAELAQWRVVQPRALSRERVQVAEGLAGNSSMLALKPRPRHWDEAARVIAAAWEQREADGWEPVQQLQPLQQQSETAAEATTKAAEVPASATSSSSSHVSSSLSSSSAALNSTAAGASSVVSDTSPLRTAQLHQCTRLGRARVLESRAGLATVSPSLVAAASAADDGGDSARALLRRLISIATLSGRAAVLPSFNCSAPWISKRNGAVDDLRVVVVDPAAAAPLHAQRCAPCNVQFACRRHVLSEAQAQLVLASASPRARSVLKLDVPLLPSSAPRCASFPGADCAADATLTQPRQVDVLALWRTLAQMARKTTQTEDRSTAAATARPVSRSAEFPRVLEFSSLADVPAEASEIDVPLLIAAPTVAASLVHSMCGVAFASPMLPDDCPTTYRAIAVGLRRWWETLKVASVADSKPASHEQGKPTSALSRPSRPSSLSLALGMRCSDMLCSEDACEVQAERECVKRLNQSAASSADRQFLCSQWLDSLPKQLRAVCNGFSGQCLAPPDAHPQKVAWPDARCIGGPPSPRPRLCIRRPPSFRSDQKQKVEVQEGHVEKCQPCH